MRTMVAARVVAAAELTDSVPTSTLLSVNFHESLVLLCAILNVAIPDKVALNRPA